MRFDFSEEPHGLSYRTVWHDLFQVTGGEITHVRRVVRHGSSQWWLITFTPATDQGNMNMKVSYASPLPACGQSGAVCTADGRALSGLAALLIPAR